jgi:hypothetical protein
MPEIDLALLQCNIRTIASGADRGTLTTLCRLFNGVSREKASSFMGVPITERVWRDRVGDGLRREQKGSRSCSAGRARSVTPEMGTAPRPAFARP